MANGDGSLPIEQFIQALTTQLDHAQSAMRVKANNLNLPLTFAVKDLALDLRAHVDVVRSEVRIRPAGPGDRDASTLRFSLTTITRPMIEENAVEPLLDREGESLKEVIGEDLSDDDYKRLEWAGVQTVSQLRRLQESGSDRTIERVANLPVNRLRQALARAADAPRLEHVTARPGEPDEGADLPGLLRLRGRNLARGGAPRVTIGGEAVSVVSASDQEVLVAPLAHQLSGVVVVETGTGGRAETAFDARPHWPVPRAAAPTAEPENAE